MKKKIGVLILTASLLSAALSGCTIGNTEIVFNRNTVGRNDVFSINGVNCTKEEAKLYLSNYKNIYGNEHGMDLWEHDFGEDGEQSSLEVYVKDITLSELANVMCMNQLAQKQNITLTAEESGLVSKAAEEYYASLTQEEIRYMGITKSKLRDYYEKYAVAKKVYNQLTQGINEEVSDDEARVMQVQQIFVKDKDKAKTVQQKLEQGADFLNLAGNYNEADAIERYISRGMYPQKVEDVVFYLQDGEVSGIIASEDGYYFVKCVDKYVEDMTEANKENIIIKRREEQFDNVFHAFIEESDFLLNESVWSDIRVDTSAEVQTDSFFAVYNQYFNQ